jgi:hypothetical protein
MRAEVVKGADMKKWLWASLVLLLLGASAVFGFVKYTTGMGPLTLLKVSQGGFQTDPAVLVPAPRRALAVIALCIVVLGGGPARAGGHAH